jgi:biopolymer transport protein ExbB
MPIAAGFFDSFTANLSKVWDFLVAGGWFMIPIGLCSLVLVAVIIWKALELRRPLILPPDLESRLREAGPLISAGKYGTLQQAVMHDSSPLAVICRAALLQGHSSQESAARAAETTGREEVSRLENGLGVMEVIFTISPMIGLIGTTGGLVRIFGNFGATAEDAAAAREIAAGIAEAMTTTIAGLGVAVPALIAHVYFSRRLERMALRMSRIVQQTLDTVWQSPAA